MPQYTLQVVQGTPPSLQDTVYTLNVTGSSASGVNVKYKAPGDTGWTSFTGTVTYTTASGGNGTPANPHPGDTLALDGSLGANPNPVYSLDGDATYDPPGSNGHGYFRVPGAKADEGDWAAKSN